MIWIRPQQFCRQWWMVGLLLMLIGKAAAVVPAARAIGEPCDLDCLICEGMNDPQAYAEGVMKAMKTLTPGYDRWLFRSEVDLANRFGMTPSMELQFARLIRAFADKGTRVVMAVQPTRGLMHRDKVRPDHAHGFHAPEAIRSVRDYLEQMRRSGAVVPDVMPIIEQLPEQDYFFRRDHHWTPYGARITAEIVAEAIKSLPEYARVPRKRYLTEKGVVLSKDGTMNRALDRLCGNNYGFQYVQGYRTIPLADDADALFGDVEDPQVVLVGTSNSAERSEETKNYNFDGYLKDFLSVDILNHAQPGAGEAGALLNYLMSQDYDVKTPPRILIWELPVNFRLSDPLTYRQLLPAVAGGCAAMREKSLNQPHHFKADVAINVDIDGVELGQRVELLSNSGLQRRRDLVGGNGFLELRISDKNFKDFYLITYYDNGQRDKVRFRREAIVEGGLFHLELSRAPEVVDANLLSVFMEPMQEIKAGTRMEIALCR